MALIDRVKEASRKQGLSLTEVAIKAGIGEKSIYAWKNREPSIAIVQKVADVLNVSTDYLLERENKNSYVSATTEKVDLDDVLDKETILALDGMAISDEDKEKILDYARYVIEQRQRGSK